MCFSKFFQEVSLGQKVFAILLTGMLLSRIAHRVELHYLAASQVSAEVSPDNDFPSIIQHIPGPESTEQRKSCRELFVSEGLR